MLLLAKPLWSETRVMRAPKVGSGVRARQEGRGIAGAAAQRSDPAVGNSCIVAFADVATALAAGAFAESLTAPGAQPTSVSVEIKVKFARDRPLECAVPAILGAEQPLFLYHSLHRSSSNSRVPARA